jgi:voltage-gated potassium channel
MADRNPAVFSDKAVLAIAVAGLVALSLLSVGGLPEAARMALVAILVAIWAYFTAELGVHLHANGGRVGGYLTSAAGVCDLAAVALPLLAVGLGLEARDAALVCGVWVAKLAKETTALRLIARVLATAGGNLLSVTAVFGVVMFLAALLAHLAERNAQPEAFGSIPAALWWAVATLTTTGYGDITPVTVAGRVLAGVVMTAGIATFALWAGILVTGFADELRRQEFLRNWEMVATVPLFSTLDAKALAEIVRLLRARRVQAGSVVCREGDPGEQMYFIADGEVEVATAMPVRLATGDFFGELALITGEPRAASVKATVPTSLLVLDISDFRMLCAENAEMAETITREAERRLATLPGRQASAP